MAATRPTTVEVETSLRLRSRRLTAAGARQPPLRPSGPVRGPCPVPPRPASGEAVSWSFARELLVAGLDEPAGIGDVRVGRGPAAAR